MSVTVTGTPTQLLDSSTANPDTFAGATHASASGTNRALALISACRLVSGTSPTSTTGAWGAHGLTRAGAIQFTDNTVSAISYELSLWYLIDPPASEANAFSINYTGSPPSVTYALAINLDGSLGPISFGGIATNENDADPGDTTPNCDLTTTEDNALVLGAVNTRQVANTISWSELTVLAAQGSGGASNRLFTGWAAQAAAGLVNYDGVLNLQDEWGMLLGWFYETAVEGGGIADQPPERRTAFLPRDDRRLFAALREQGASIVDGLVPTFFPTYRQPLLPRPPYDHSAIMRQGSRRQAVLVDPPAASTTAFPTFRQAQVARQFFDTTAIARAGSRILPALIDPPSPPAPTGRRYRQRRRYPSRVWRS